MGKGNETARDSRTTGKNIINTVTRQEELTGTPQGEPIVQGHVHRHKKDLPEGPLSENETYFERILNNTRDKNLALNIRSFEKLNKEGWTVAEDSVPVFKPKLPAAKDTWRGRRAEKNAINNAKLTFRNADVCTVREQAALEAYFQTFKNGEDPLVTGENVPGDPTLTEYVNNILSFELNHATLTDDYLSENITVVFEYLRKLRQYETLRQKYPAFFGALNDGQRVLLDTRAAAASDMGKVMKDHMYLHGIELERTSKGFVVKLRRESENEQVRHAERNRLKAEYKKKLNDFLELRIRGDEVNIARSYTKDKAYDSAGVMEKLTAGLSTHKMAMEACGEEIETASGEIRKALTVRDEFLEKQRQLLKLLESEKSHEKKEDIKAQIAHNNKRIRLATSHAENYRDFLDFVIGVKPGINNGTTKFLEAENHPELLDLVRFKMLGNCLEYAITKNDFMSPERFYDKYDEYKTVKKEGEEYIRFKKQAEERMEAGKKAAKRYAEKYGIPANKVTFDRVSPMFISPFEDKKKDTLPDGKMIDYEALCIFSGYTPDEQTDEEIKKDVVKAVMPLVEELPSLTPQKLMDMKCPANPDPEDPEFWHNRSIVLAGHAAQDILERLRSWSIGLTGDQYAHLIAIGKVAEALCTDYENYDAKMADPMSVAVIDDRLTDKVLEEVNDKVFNPYYIEEKPSDPAVAKKMDRFGKKRPGLTLKIPMKGKLKNTTVLDAMTYYINEEQNLRQTRIDQKHAEDPVQLYEQKKQEILKEEDEFSREKE
ncbi:MAG: hypothetical protein IJU87_03810, partial [Lachnospiraceae bacterium]|nr:hypothetical protein [Lachnospiraceae bacterium]